MVIVHALQLQLFYDFQFQCQISLCLQEISLIVFVFKLFNAPWMLVSSKCLDFVGNSPSNIYHIFGFGKMEIRKVIS